MARAEQPASRKGDPDYVGRFREFKYQEMLFEMFARQYELARVDESREGVLIQVIDPAAPAERKSSPKRAYIAAVVGFATFILLFLYVVIRELWKRHVGIEPSAVATRRDPDLRAS